jgi:hypothetical protein
VLAVIVALLLFWQLSQNGHYTFMNHPEGVVLIVDTRTMDVRVRLLEVNGEGSRARYHWVRVPPDEKPIKPESMMERLERTDVYHCALERARPQGRLHDLR